MTINFTTSAIEWSNEHCHLLKLVQVNPQWRFVVGFGLLAAGII
jgi:hypothetical protein